MATKLTISNLKTLARAYIDTDKVLIESGDFVLDRNYLSNLIVKIGKQLLLDSDFTDNLPELDAADLPYGTTIEEYWRGLKLPTNFDGDGTNNMAPDRLAFEAAVYSKELGRKTFSETIDDYKYNNAMLGAEELSTLVATLIKRLYDSKEMFTFAIKRQLIGEAIERATNTQKIQIAKPVDATTGEAFAKKVKELHTQLTKFTTETYNNGGVIAKSPEVVLYVKGADITPSLDVDVLAGAFNVDRALVPVQIKELQDFGTLGAGFEDVYAVLFDPRGIKLHPHNISSAYDHNGKGEFTNQYLHATYTAFISNYTNFVYFTP